MTKTNGAAKGANPAKPGVPLELDRPRRLLFDLNALAALEEQTGKNMLSAEGWAAFAEPGARQMRLLLWAGLLHEQPELTPERVGALITPEKMDKIAAAIEAATTASLPEAAPDPTPRTARKKGRRRPGSSSGPSPATTSP